MKQTRKRVEKEHARVDCARVALSVRTSCSARDAAALLEHCASAHEQAATERAAFGHSLRLALRVCGVQHERLGVCVDKGHDAMQSAHRSRAGARSLYIHD